MKMKCTLFCLVMYTLFYYSVSGQVRKSETSMAERVQKLTDLANSNAVLTFNTSQFRDYVKSTPRNYSIIVMFTHRRCLVCRLAHDEFVIVANSFRYSQAYSNKLFFAVMDFVADPDVFQMMLLKTVPGIIHFPQRGKPKNLDNLDIERVGFSAYTIAKWINDRIDTNIRVFRPANHSRTIALVVLLAFLAIILYLRTNNLEFLYNKNMWAGGALFFCCCMVSGQMWNVIEGPPFMYEDQNGQITYIEQSPQAQLVLETYIVLVLNGAIVLGMILLFESRNKKHDLQMSNILAVAGLMLVSVFLFLLLSVFRFKKHNYPYSFLFK